MEFWCFAVEHSVYIKNRILTAALPFGEGKLAKANTLFKAYKEAIPNLLKLRVFSCTAMLINTLQKHLGKLDSRFKARYIFIAIKGSKIYKLFNMLTYKVENYRDANFNKYRFLLR